MKTLLIFLTCLTATITSHAQASFFDPSFGSGGKAIIPLGATENGVFDALAIQPDGKIVVVGIMEGNATIARFKTNGTPDTAFAINGFYSYTGAVNSRLYDVALQPDGKIVAEGSHIDSGFLTIRLNSNGIPDATFGSGGIVTSDFDLGTDGGYALAVQPDNKIVIAGFSSPSNIGVMRLHANGLVDSSFGVNGIEKSVYGNARGIDIAPDGKIVAGGHATASHNYALMAVRWKPDGTLDNSFNHTGVVYTIAGEPGSNFGRPVRVQPDGKVLVAGTGGFGAEGSNSVIVRYNVDGSLDGSFGSGGIANIDFYGENDGAACIYLMPDGKILLGGSTGPSGASDFAMARLNSNGTLDNTFGNNGRIVASIREKIDAGRAIGMQGDGRIVMAGNSVKSGSATYTDPVIARFLPDATDVDDLTAHDRAAILYPNPASGQLIIAGQYVGRIVCVSASDMTGMGKSATIKTDGTSIDINNLPDGLYCLRLIFDDGSVVVQKILVDSNIK